MKNAKTEKQNRVQYYACFAGEKNSTGGRVVMGTGKTRRTAYDEAAKWADFSTISFADADIQPISLSDFEKINDGDNSDPYDR